jgi:hypothetical protein
LAKLIDMTYYLSFLFRLSPLLIFLLLEYFVYNIGNIFYILFVILFLVFFSVKNIKVRGDLDIKWYIFLIFPILLEISFVTYLMMEMDYLRPHLLLLVNSVILYFYFRTLRSFFSGVDRGDSLNNITIFGNFILVFFMASSVYGLQSFLRFPVWILMIVFVVFLAMIVYSVMYINKIKYNIALFYVLIVCLVMMELAWSIYFLPVTYKISGLVLAIGYYIIMGLSRHHLKDSLNPRTVKLYFSFGFVSIILVLLTSRWV